MSMRSSFIYGFGFNSDCDEGKLIDFIKNHKETFCESDEEKELYKEMLGYTENEYDLKNLFEDYSCDNTGTEGVGAVIANREVVANHLAYTHMYMFLVAEY